MHTCLYVHIHICISPHDEHHPSGETLERGRNTCPTPSNTVAAREPVNDGVISYNGGASDRYRTGIAPADTVRNLFWPASKPRSQNQKTKGCLARKSTQDCVS